MRKLYHDTTMVVIPKLRNLKNLIKFKKKNNNHLVN